jgi:murein L,D-transpeptidase YcbB/YkuD
VLPEFYRNRDFTPAWNDLSGLNGLLRAIQASAADGLDPRDYHFFLIQARLKEKGVSSAQRAELDVLATDAAIRLGYHLLFGKVDPERLDADWNMARKGTDFQPVARLQEAIDSGRVYEMLDEFKPKHPFYGRLKQALAKYRAIEAEGGWEPIPVGRTLKKDESDPRVPAIRRRLALSGDLPSNTEGSRSDLFDEALQTAVRRFQVRHGLHADGVLGGTTVEAMSVPVQRRIDQIRVNLECARWVLHDVGDKLVMVNIAGFELYLARDGRRQWETRVQVGKPYRKTPIFKSEIRYVVLNPTWSVPPTVLAADILPAIKRNPSYLQTHRLRVIDGNGKVVNPAQVKWSAYTAKNFPYRLEQEAGPQNALGRIKFMFPNQYSVYLHDTPKKELFRHSARAFSSGCIRVEDPLRLAELLLDDPGKWNRTRIDQAVATGKTVTIHLDRPVPVLLLYWTAASDPDGQVDFLPDIYGRDATVLKALNGEFRYRKRPVRVAKSQ